MALRLRSIIRRNIEVKKKRQSFKNKSKKIFRSTRTVEKQCFEILDELSSNYKKSKKSERKKIMGIRDYIMFVAKFFARMFIVDSYENYK